ncbi:MAG: DUF5320 domain-containing protein [Desulforhopalus sp.]
MPGFNQKGPDGAGAMTGRQRGLCRRTEDQPFGGDGSGRGRGLGMRRGLGQGQGLGQGRRLSGNDELPKDGKGESLEQLSTLKEQYQAAQKTLSLIEEKIAALKGRK